MGDNVLYFPYIRVPQSVWFSRVLLYWDKVGSIVPSEYQSERSRLGPYMENLVESGLVREVVPAEHDSKVPQFRSSFLQMIDLNPIIVRRRGAALKRHQTTLIHIEKMIGNGLTVELIDRGLAKRAEYPWWEVETTTANLFMGYLASVLGRLDELQMCPVTDRASALSVFSKTPQRILSTRSLVNDLRMAVLTDVLPSPSLSIPVRDLVSFKERHSTLLPSFRRRIEAFLIDLAAINDDELRKEKLRLFKEEAEAQISEITARMNERRWPRIVFGGVGGIVAAAIPGIGAILSGNAKWAAASLPGLAVAAYSAFTGMPDHQREILREPLAYAAFAHKQLSIGDLTPENWSSESVSFVG